jgi:hypothetical protein
MRQNMKLMRPILSALVLSAALPGLMQGQSAAEIMRQALDAQVDRLAGVENVRIVQDIMGMETSVYMEKREMDGVPVLFPVSISVAGMTNPVPQDMAQSDWSNPFQDEWIERAKLEGEETLDGHRSYILAIDDFNGLELPGMPGGNQAGGITPKSMRFWMDRDDFLTRKVEMDMEGKGQDGSPQNIHMELFMEDYREVDGYIHPFVTRTLTRGMMQAADLDQAEIEAQLAQMRAQLDQIPEAQRAMVEGMLNAQIERLETMLNSEDGNMEMTITVKEIRVNAGG